MAYGLCKYYILLFVVFIALGILCIRFNSTYGEYQCVKEITTTATKSSLRFLATDNSTNSNTTINGTNDGNTTTKALGNDLTSMTGVLSGFYITEGVLCLLTCLFISCYSKMLPREFSKMGRIKNCAGALLKILPKIINLLHALILILICVQIAKSASSACE